MENTQPDDKDKVPFFRMILHDFMLLLFLGVTIYSIFYLLWGVMELSASDNFSPLFTGATAAGAFLKF